MGRQTSTIRVSLQIQCPPTYSYICPSAPLYNIQYSKCVITHLQRKICCAQVSQATTRVSGTRQSQKGKEKGKRESSCRARTRHQFAPPPHLPELPPLPGIHQKGGWGQFAPADTRICPREMRIVGTPGPAMSICIWREGTDTPDTCPDCCCCSKSHESFTNCQSLKSDNSSHRFCISRRSNTWPRMHSYRIQTSGCKILTTLNAP